MRYPKTLSTLFFLIVFCLGLAAQDAILPIANYTFANNLVVEKTGNSELLLHNGASLINDAARGSVLHFNSAEKSYALFNKQLLNSDNCTISFFFFWENQGSGSWHQLF